jgi:hypothetical protein
VTNLETATSNPTKFRALAKDDGHRRGITTTVRCRYHRHRRYQRNTLSPAADQEPATACSAIRRPGELSVLFTPKFRLPDRCPENRWSGDQLCAIGFVGTAKRDSMVIMSLLQSCDASLRRFSPSVPMSTAENDRADLKSYQTNRRTRHFCVMNLSKSSKH